MKKLLILGAGQYGLVAKEIAQELGKYDEISFLDDSNQMTEGKLSDITSVQYDEVVVAIGNPEIREQLINKAKNITTLIHPMACVSKSAVIGEGCIIEAGAVVSTSAKVGKGCIIMANAVVGHNAQVGEYCQLKYNSTVAENCVVEKYKKVECNAVCKL